MRTTNKQMLIGAGRKVKRVQTREPGPPSALVDFFYRCLAKVTKKFCLKNKTKVEKAWIGGKGD